MEGSVGNTSHFMPLQSIFPVERWPKLQHFGLSNFLITQSDVISLLATLPSTLRSVELSFLEYLDHGGHWYGLLQDIRDKLGWRERDNKPKVIASIAPWPPRAGFGIWIEKDTNKFLYEDSPCPFREESRRSILPGTGIMRDTFEPEHERPYTNHSTLARMGYIKKSK